MLKYTFWLSLACATLIQIGTASPTLTNNRKSRSIWPFTTSDTETEIKTESLLDEENALLLEKAGLGKTFNLSSHPIWRVHKYKGIDLKPVHIETEIIKAAESADSNSNVNSASVNTQATVGANGNVPFKVDYEDEFLDKSTGLLRLPFFDDLNGFADYLADPEEDDEATVEIAKAIEKEEEKNPGFFRKFWWKLWGEPAAENEATAEIAKAIEKEEEKNPGFFKRLWWKLWGEPTTETVETTTAPTTAIPTTTTELPTEKSKKTSKSGFFSSLFSFGNNNEEEEIKEDDVPLTVYLPETQGPYVAIVVPSEQQINDQQISSPNALLPNKNSEFKIFQKKEEQLQEQYLIDARTNSNANKIEAEEPITAATAASADKQEIEVEKPVASPNKNFSRSRAWTQVWTPHASYKVNVQGPAPANHNTQESTTLSSVSLEHVSPLIDTFENPQARSIDSYQRRISNDDIVFEDDVKATEAEKEIVQSENNLSAELPPTTATTEATTTTAATTATIATTEATTKSNDTSETVTPVEDAKTDSLNKVKKLLSNFQLPPTLLETLEISNEEIDAILDGKQSPARVANRLRALQRIFEMKKDVLSIPYAKVRTQKAISL